MILPIHDDHGQKFAEFRHNEGDEQALLVMTAPDGFSGRQACWKLSEGELTRLTDAGDRVAVKIAAGRSKNATA